MTKKEEKLCKTTLDFATWGSIFCPFWGTSRLISGPAHRGSEAAGPWALPHKCDVISIWTGGQVIDTISCHPAANRRRLCCCATFLFCHRPDRCRPWPQGQRWGPIYNLRVRGRHKSCGQWEMLKQTAGGTEPSAPRSRYSWVSCAENLTFTSGPDRACGRWEWGPCPALTPVVLLVMALITAPGHHHVLAMVC